MTLDSGTQRLVVIGNGMAGARTVEEILARNGDFTITMFGDEPYGNYNRIMLSNLLAGVEDEAGIFLNDLQWYQDNGITLHAGTRIERIDRAAREVVAADGTRTPYDKLVIATGSSSWTPPIKNIHNPKRGFHQVVFAFRTLDDTRGMIRYARDHERAVVIGGTQALLPVAMISLSYPVVVPSLACTTLADRSIRSIRVPACSVMPLSAYQLRSLRKMPASSSTPASRLESMIRL